MQRTIHIQLLAYPGAQKSALWGLQDLFDHATTEAASQTNTQAAPTFHSVIENAPHGAPDIVLLPPALTLTPPQLPSQWEEALTAQHAKGTILASVCSGAFLLAGAGLTDGRRITTHWRHAAIFQTMYPKTVIDTDKLLVDLGDIITAGGVMAWTDLGLHLIDRFGSRKLMLDVARMFVLDPPEREQSYYASFQPKTDHSDAAILKIQNLLLEQPDQKHDLTTLAAKIAVSERSFLRRFKLATGLTPVRYLQLVRIEAARARLELTRDSFETISWDLGYRDTAAFRRIFKRTIGLSPSAYRARFGRRV